MFRAFVAALALLAPLLIAPTAAASPPGCGPGRFAVGGYPKPHLVPDGYTYTGTPGGLFGHENGGYNYGQTVGAHNLVVAVDAHAAACDGPIHVYGHSYGAGVVHTAVETLDTRHYAKRVHVHLTGNPRHPGGIEDSYRGWTFLPGITMRGAGHQPGNLGSFTDVCNYGRDYVCDAPRLIADPVGFFSGIFGYFGSGHSYS